jgi:hypothetical protein
VSAPLCSSLATAQYGVTHRACGARHDTRERLADCVRNNEVIGESESTTVLVRAMKVRERHAESRYRGHNPMHECTTFTPKPTRRCEVVSLFLVASLGVPGRREHAHNTACAHEQGKRGEREGNTPLLLVERTDVARVLVMVEYLHKGRGDECWPSATSLRRR